MKTRLASWALVWFLVAGAVPIRAAEPPAVTEHDLLPMSRLEDAQRTALAQGKPVGFLLTWPIFFPGAKDFHRNGSLSASYFYQAFKDQAVLVNVNHATDDPKHLPRVATDAFASPAEGGFAPCLCLTDAKCTRLIGMIPLWEDPAEREKFFQQFRAVIADPKRWGEDARGTVVTGAAAPKANPAVGAAPSAPVARPAVLTPAPVSSGFAREMELTRQAEQQRQKAAPPP